MSGCEVDKCASCAQDKGERESKSGRNMQYLSLYLLKKCIDRIQNGTYSTLCVRESRVCVHGVDTPKDAMCLFTPFRVAQHSAQPPRIQTRIAR